MEVGQRLSSGTDESHDDKQEGDGKQVFFHHQAPLRGLIMDRPKQLTFCRWFHPVFYISQQQPIRSNFPDNFKIDHQRRFEPTRVVQPNSRCRPPSHSKPSLA
jgi:hypothetical protein